MDQRLKSEKWNHKSRRKMWEFFYYLGIGKIIPITVENAKGRRKNIDISLSKKSVCKKMLWAESKDPRQNICDLSHRANLIYK